MSYKPKAPPVMATPNVIPMADIMLVLLIIFMVVTPMLQRGHQVELARVDNPKDLEAANQDDAIILAVTRDGNIFLGATQIRKEEITNQLKDLLANRLDKTVFVKSDGRAKYGVVVSVVDEIRAAGVDKLGLWTERTTNQRAAPPPPPASD